MRALTKITFPLLLAVIFVASSAIAVATEPAPSDYPNRVVFIRHAEKGFTPGARPSVHHNRSKGRWWAGMWDWEWPGRPRGPPGYPQWPGRKFPNGLSDKGRERAQYIRTLFGRSSEYNFGKLFAAPRSVDDKTTERTYATVEPLAKDLGLEIDIECAESEARCIVEKIKAFVVTSEADILISWKHRDLKIIATALGAPNAKRIYPDDRNDVIWIMQNGAIVEKSSMHCPGLDDKRVDEGDPDLEVEQPQQSALTWVTAFLRGLRDVWRFRV